MATSVITFHVKVQYKNTKPNLNNLLLHIIKPEVVRVNPPLIKCNI